jgi:hypothetical protein
MDGRKDCRKVSLEKDKQKRRQLLEDGQAENRRTEGGQIREFKDKEHRE